MKSKARGKYRSQRMAFLNGFHRNPIERVNSVLLNESMRWIERFQLKHYIVTTFVSVPKELKKNDQKVGNT